MGRCGRLVAIGLAIAALSSACAAHVFSPPSGPGAPAPEAAAAWADATSACRDVRNANVSLRVAVREGPWRSPTVPVLVAVTASGQLLLDGANLFVLAGTSAEAQLLLREDNRLVTARAEDIVEAFIGVRLGPERLLAVLTGCVSTTPARPIASGVRYVKQIAVGLADARVFIEKRDGRWRARGGDMNGVTIEYRAFNGYWPSHWRATSGALQAESRVLDVQVTDVQMNDAAIDSHPDAFRLKPSAGAARMTLDELRASGLLRPRR